MTRISFLISLILVLFVGPQVYGQESFHELPRQDQDILSPFKDIWPELPVERRQSLRRGVQRWSEMSPEQRQQMKERFQRFREMSPEQRQELRQRHKKFRDLPPEEQQRRRQRWQQLPPEKKEELRRRWQQRRLDREMNYQGAGKSHLKGQRRPENSRPTGDDRLERRRKFMDLSPEEQQDFREKRRLQRLERHLQSSPSPPQQGWPSAHGGQGLDMGARGK